MDGPDEEDEPFRPPLPMEDRLWRHPSEVAASQRAHGEAQIETVTIRTPLRQALALAAAGAVGGALVMTGLFLTLGNTGGVVIDRPTKPVIQAVALDPILPVAEAVPAGSWPGTVAERSAGGVALLEVKGPSGTRTGSGVVFRSDGYLLTSYDLVSSVESIEVSLASGQVYAGQVLGADKISGVAVVTIDERDAVTAPLALLDAPTVGDHAVTLVGLADTNTLEHTTVSAVVVSVPVSGDQNLHGLIQIDAGAPDGASGGAIVGDSGGVLGIVVDVGGDNVTYGVPIGYARKIAADIVAEGAAQHTWLGIRGVTDDQADAGAFGLDQAVRVQSVNIESPADAAQIVKGDVIIAVDGRPVGSMTELILELRRHPPGETVEVAVIHRGTKHLRLVELGTRMVDDTT